MAPYLRPVPDTDAYAASRALFDTVITRLGRRRRGRMSLHRRSGGRRTGGAHGGLT
jgi:hypothetical protein